MSDTKPTFQYKKMKKLLKTINSTDKQWQKYSLSTVVPYLAFEQ